MENVWWWHWTLTIEAVVQQVILLPVKGIIVTTEKMFAISKNVIIAMLTLL